MTRTRYRVYDSSRPHFLTCSVVGWLPVFSHPEAVRILFDSWAWLLEKKAIRLFAHVVLENHLHFIASGESLEKDVGRFKSYTARRIIDWLEERPMKTLLRQLRAEKAVEIVDREYQLWQEGSHPKEMQTDEMMWDTIEYIHDNPAARGYVDDPLHWRYSSARNYAGQAGLIPVCTEW